VSEPQLPALAFKEGRQLVLWADDPSAENPEYLSRQLLTYIGNKRALLGHIGIAVERVKQRLGKRRLRVFDAFSGSGVVSRFLKAHASSVISNDLEDYAAVTARCYLRNRSSVDIAAISATVADLNKRVATERLTAGFIEELYSPRDEKCITKEDRVFYTKSNARRLDNYRRLIDTAPYKIKEMLIGPLISRASGAVVRLSRAYYNALVFGLDRACMANAALPVDSMMRFSYQ